MVASLLPCLLQGKRYISKNPHSNSQDTVLAFLCFIWSNAGQIDKLKGKATGSYTGIRIIDL